MQSTLPSHGLHTDHDQPQLQKRETEKIFCQALSFSRDGLCGLIRTPSPNSFALKLHTMHSHTHTTTLCSINTTQGILLYTHTHMQTNQAVVDLCTGAGGKLTSNIITVCLVYSSPILSSFLSALSALRLAQVKTLW